MEAGVWLGTTVAGGMALGLFFYGGLWLTVRGLARSPNPGRVVLFSFFVRSAVVVAALYLLGGGSARRLAAAMVGFIGVRWLLSRVIASGDKMS